MTVPTPPRPPTKCWKCGSQNVTLTDAPDLCWAATCSACGAAWNIRKPSPAATPTPAEDPPRKLDDMLAAFEAFKVNEKVRAFLEGPEPRPPSPAPAPTCARPGCGHTLNDHLYEGNFDNGCLVGVFDANAVGPDGADPSPDDIEAIDQVLWRMYERGRRFGIEEAARVVEGGVFLHAEAPDARWARDAAAAIRRALASSPRPGGTSE